MTSAIMPAVSRTLRTLADGTVRLQVDIEPEHATEAMTLFGVPGAPMALAALTPAAAMQDQQKRSISMYGRQARALRQSSFFRNPSVWTEAGTDDEFLAWIRTRPSAISNQYSEMVNGEGRCVAAHVRRAATSGTGIKPKYSAIPLTDNEHRIQHEKGESALRPKEWWAAKAVEYAEEWAWRSVKKQLGYEHWSEVPPGRLNEWATARGLERFLPEDYQDV